MTQKPPEMPQEIFVCRDKVYVGSDYNNHFFIAADTSFLPEEDARYILAPPKEDVERALECLEDLIDDIKHNAKELELIAAHFRPEYETYFKDDPNTQKDREITRRQLLTMRDSVIENERVAKRDREVVTHLETIRRVLLANAGRKE